MTTITELRKKKKKWMEDTLTESQLVKELGLDSKDIEQLKPENKYGKVRYRKEKVRWYLNTKDSPCT
ncbi:hypothetical protein HOE67_00695 [Candidatus Peregrinibacteria bacterium]|jgi:hypothetical protein|nr:hypothetical protein [Candidatus Peregrinibacteria bacterium]MBT4055607.1 hypothetical protein [Candidatus Peregrinibacteria bacterium]